MRKIIDTVPAGVFFGLVAPFIGLFIYYAFTYQYQTTFRGFLEYFSSLHIIVASISLSVYISNLPLFFICIWREYNRTARGVLMATVVYTFWVVYEKFFA